MTNVEKSMAIAHEYFRRGQLGLVSIDTESAGYDCAMQAMQWKDKQVLEKTLKWFQENLQPHTDWTGTRIETRFKCESLDELFNSFKKSIE